MTSKIIIIGGGITGLTCGYFSKGYVFEQENHIGGLLASYCFNISSNRKWYCIERNSNENNAYFDKGGHWLWGLDERPHIRDLLHRLSSLEKFARKASVYLVDYDVFIPYPIQYHIGMLPRDLRNKALEDLLLARRELLPEVNKGEITFAEFLKKAFGEALYKIFFEPFNYMYTAGLLYEIAPPRYFKAPNDLNLILKGAKEPQHIENSGYNAYFYYPTIGLGSLIWKLYSNLGIKVHLTSKVTSIDIMRKKITINDSITIEYDKIYAAIPLVKILRLIESIERENLIKKADPFTSVLVINAIAKRSHKVPQDHWIYLPRTKSGFYRIGFYSNVSKIFLPKRYRNEDYVAIYIEKALPGNQNRLNLDNEVYKILDEVIELNLVNEIIAFTYDFIEVGYTWERVKSTWVDESLQYLRSHNIIGIGRYGKWGRIESIVESMEDAYINCYLNVVK